MSRVERSFDFDKFKMEAQSIDIVTNRAKIKASKFKFIMSP